MLCYASIPSDVIELILQRTLYCGKDPQAFFRDNLYLLTVCREWRNVAAPLVYKSAFIIYGRQTNKTIAREHTYGNMVIEPDDASAATNLGLAISAGYAHAIRAIEIKIHCQANPFFGLARMVSLLEAIPPQNKPMHLKMGMFRNMHHYPSFVARPDNYIADMDGISQAVARAFSNIRQLTFESAGLLAIAVELFGRIASKYADKATSLTSSHPINMPAGFAFKKLEYLDMNISIENKHQISPIYAKSLKEIKLFNGASNHSWDSFMADDEGAADIVFSNLKRLDLDYTIITVETLNASGSDQPRFGKVPRLVFPKLDYLRVHDISNNCPVLERAVLPSHINRISIKITDIVYQLIRDIIRPFTHSLNISTDTRYRHPRTMFILNSIICREQNVGVCR